MASTVLSIFMSTGKSGFIPCVCIQQEFFIAVFVEGVLWMFIRIRLELFNSYLTSGKNKTLCLFATEARCRGQWLA